MHPYLIEQLVNERIAELRQAAADRAAHPGRHGGERRLRAARREEVHCLACASAAAMGHSLNWIGSGMTGGWCAPVERPVRRP